MRVPLEDFTPYDQSVRWRLHDAYFAARARAAIPDDRIGIYAPAVQARMAEMLAHRAIFEQQADTEARYLELLAPYQGGAT